MPNSPFPCLTLFAPPFRRLSFFLYSHPPHSSCLSSLSHALSLSFIFTYLPPHRWISCAFSLCAAHFLFSDRVSSLFRHPFIPSLLPPSLYLALSLFRSHFLSHARTHVHTSSCFVAPLVQRPAGRPVSYQLAFVLDRVRSNKRQRRIRSTVRPPRKDISLESESLDSTEELKGFRRVRGKERGFLRFFRNSRLSCVKGWSPLRRRLKVSNWDTIDIHSNLF